MKIQTLPSGPLMVNTYLAVDEDTKKGFIVDPGGFDQRMMEAIKSENIHVKYIILTHGHGDHIGGVNKYKEILDNVKVVASADEVQLLGDSRQNMSMDLGMNSSVQPDIVVYDGDTLKVGNLELKFLMTPGHSLGGMCILSGNILFSGDTLFRASVGRTDFPGCSFDDLVKSIHEKLFVLPDDTNVFPGHMEPTTIGFEKRNNPFV